MNKLAYTLAALAFLAVGASMAQAAEPEPVLVVTTDSTYPAVNRRPWPRVDYLPQGGAGRREGDRRRNQVAGLPGSDQQDDERRRPGSA